MRRILPFEHNPLIGTYFEREWFVGFSTVMDRDSVTIDRFKSDWCTKNILKVSESRKERKVSESRKERKKKIRFKSNRRIKNILRVNNEARNKREKEREIITIDRFRVIGAQKIS